MICNYAFELEETRDNPIRGSYEYCAEEAVHAYYMHLVDGKDGHNLRIGYCAEHWGLLVLLASFYPDKLKGFDPSLEYRLPD